MAKKTPIFDYSVCVACGICEQACPVSALELSKLGVDKYNKAYPEVVRECSGCSICSKACPLEAITMTET